MAGGSSPSFVYLGLSLFRSMDFSPLSHINKKQWRERGKQKQKKRKKANYNARRKQIFFLLLLTCSKWTPPSLYINVAHVFFSRLFLLYRSLENERNVFSLFWYTVAPTC